MSKRERDVRTCGFLERCSLRVTGWAGGTAAFAVAVGVVLAWAVTGPFFRYSDTWQLVINTGTTIVTFLMVFLIQRAQNKESKAVQLKLNEIVAAVHGASNRLIDVESLSETEIARLQEHFRKLADITKSEGDARVSHSIEEAEETLDAKRRTKGRTPVSAARPDTGRRPRAFYAPKPAERVERDA